MTFAWGGPILVVMVNTDKTKMVQPKRVFRQHNSLVVTLPIMVREKLNIRQGDYVLFEWTETGKNVKIMKLEASE